MLWKLTVRSVITNAPRPDTAKIHHEISVRYWYCCSQLFRK